MLLKRLKLHNIRSYVDEEVTFPSGHTLLSGDIGCGKSTILLALEFALFGADTERISGNALLRKGTADGSVELAFTLDGKEVIVQRGLKKSRNMVQQTPGSIIVDGIRKDVMPVELKTDIINLLGYPEELATKKRNLVYNYTVYCPQEEMRAILSDEQESRLDTLRKLFGVDKYKRIRDNCALILRELRASARELEIRSEGLQELRQRQDELIARTAAIQRDLVQLSEVINRLVLRTSAQRAHIADHEKMLVQLQEKQRQLSVTGSQMHFYQGELAHNSQKIAALKPILYEQDKPVQPQDVMDEIERQEQKTTSAREQRIFLEQSLKTTRNRITELKSEQGVDPTGELEKQRESLQELAAELWQKEHIKSVLEGLERELALAMGSIKESEVKKTHALEVKRSILELAACPTCFQPVSKEHKERVCEEQDRMIRLCEKRLAELARTLNDIKGAYEKTRSKLDYCNEIEKRHAVVTKDIAHLETQQARFRQKEALLAELGQQEQKTLSLWQEQSKIDIDAELKMLSSLRQKLEHARDYWRAEKESADLQKRDKELTEQLQRAILQKQQLEQELTPLSAVQQAISQARHELDEYIGQEKQYTAKQAALQTENNEHERQHAEITNVILEKERAQASLTKLNNYLNWLDEHFTSLMAAIEKNILSRIYYEFNECVKGWFSALIADESMSARLDDSFNPVIEQNGYELDVRFLSGGERTSVALAYRLALNKVVNDIISTIKTKGLLILDEPTDGFSSEQLDRVRDVLEQLDIQQVLIVSHESKVESFVDNVIKIMKEDGRSRVAG